MAFYVWARMAFIRVFVVAPTGSDLSSWSLNNGPGCLDLFGYCPCSEVEREME